MGKKKQQKQSKNPAKDSAATSATESGSGEREMTRLQLEKAFVRAFAEYESIFEHLSPTPSASQARAINIFRDLTLAMKQDLDKSIGFSDVKQKHLDALAITRGPAIKLNMTEIRMHASSRKLSPRFVNQKRCLNKGISMMERMQGEKVLNFVLESEDLPGSPVSETSGSRVAYFAPEFRVKPVPIKRPSAETSLQGFVDLLTFTADKSTSLKQVDLSHDAQIERYVKDAPCTIEVKRLATAFTDDHLYEGVAQSLALSEMFNKHQRFILTDGVSWQFCTLRGDVYSVSETLDVKDEGDAAILTVLDEWIWHANNCHSKHNLWSYDSPKVTGN